MKPSLYFRVFGYSTSVLNTDHTVIVRVWFPGWLHLPDPQTWSLLRRWVP